VDPSNPEIAPSYAPWKVFKNEYYEKRGYTVASKDWKEWSDLPEGPFKYLGVKVDPDHVTNHGPVWSFFSDWKTAIPAAVCLSLPLWMFNILPPLDERSELGLITICAGWVALKQAGPMFRSWKRTRVAAKVKALLAHEKELNDEIATSIDSFAAGASVVDYIKIVNGADRSLRGLEAAAATKRVLAAQRDALVHQLDYLVTLQSSGAADADAKVLRSARSLVESQLEKDASLQQKSIESAIKGLRDGVFADEVVTPLFSKALEKAAADLKAQPAAKPMTNAQQIDIFRKRFGFTEDAVSESTLKRAASDPAALAVLTGKVGGKSPAVGMPYVLKPAIAYAK